MPRVTFQTDSVPVYVVVDVPDEHDERYEDDDEALYDESYVVKVVVGDEEVNMAGAVPVDIEGVPAMPTKAMRERREEEIVAAARKIVEDPMVEWPAWTFGW